jgi:preprotein translocase YajC subunit
MIVPQRKQQRRVQDMLDNLKSGDKVVFGGGIYGL